MHAVHDAVLRFISGQEGNFETLALAVFRHQFEGIAPYRRYCEQRGTGIAAVRSWREIPPVPVLAFKETELACAAPQRVFLTTGTSRGHQRRGRHALPDVRLYHASAVGGLRRFLWPDLERVPIVSLIAPPAAMPDSSLSQMVAWAMEEYPADGSIYAASAAGIDYTACAAALRAAERSGNPICLLATTAALIYLLDHCAVGGVSFRLPHGSRLMDTGGHKGAPRPLSRRGLLRACWNTFAIPGYFCVNEYGMAELSSQFYENVISNRWRGHFAPRYLVAPPWARVRLLDPATLDDVPAGERGLVCVYDLANAGTALAVLTEDIGRQAGDGFVIVGRATGAATRGCSLSAAEWDAAAESRQ
ncbi:MAG: long-chain fatty acid--CoA ligase [Deltaproteobacteria bacterium]|nr:long-chain fatty acid--CoA ligase [Deltaproteobacteria bacterium]